MSALAPILELIAPDGKKLTLSTGLFINNEFVRSDSGSKITAIDPATEAEICSVEAGSLDDVDRAVQAARAALNHPSWRDLSGTERSTLMNRLADLLEQHKETLATLETWNSGKPYQVVLDLDLQAAIGCIRYYAGWADKFHGQTIPTHSKKFAYTIRQPIGVCAQIIPWNYPILMAAWKLGPALATGNTIVLKPAEQTPLSILRIGDLIAKAEFPPGVVNIINGHGRDVGQALASHLGVDKVAFTGSTSTGKLIQRAASANLKSLTLETGGKSPLVVFDDANITQAAKWGHMGIMSNQGQICTANSRLLVQEGIYDKFIEAFVEVLKSQKIGDPFASETFQGPQVSRAQYEKILSYVRSAKEEGAKLVAGGKPYDSGGKGYFIEPTVFKDVTSDMKIYREEIFGPVVAISRFGTEEQALQMANETEYGLAASVFTENIRLAHRMASRLEAGMVWINSSVDADFRVPFGGVKQSGIGSELGEAGLEGYLQTKAVHLNMGTEI
ncbi:Aldehyde dehydrogenase (NAD+) [Pleurostoma richardsiae]|uniref:aldehyde dehydrogenase (NAD(+)) n=1 Tax=Pleurostoma richardsiae TaxID=41990 RepID=A0AA38R556_9PEZI|nr:Aldehyde dehydrogenase (NAD+) [Pleurostoma richardsiae]